MSVSGGIIARMRTMTADAARRASLAAQGFADPRPSAEPTRRHLQRVLNRTGVLQLDSVNVAVRAHYMPVYSRLGAYAHALVDDAAWKHSARKPRLLVEYWAHAACLMPVEDWPLLRFRMDDFQRRYAENPDSIVNTSPALADDVLAAVKDLGPIAAGPLERALGIEQARRKGGWWNRSDVKKACEYLFAIGALTTATRVGFERHYDLPERVLPAQTLAAPPVNRVDAVRALMAKSAASLGVATEVELRDYYRLAPADARCAVEELVDAGTLEPVVVDGWPDKAYRHVAATVPRRIAGRALLSPFDPVVWHRDRCHRIHGFHYRIEIYVPSEQRRYGYYVFPFLLDGALVARVDLKADRAWRVLRVHGAFAEDGVDRGRVAVELAGALSDMAQWLGLDGVVVAPNGDLAPDVQRAL